MPNWKKVIVSGSDASLNSINVTSGVTGSFTGSLRGTATSASFSSTASYVNQLNQNVIVTGSLTVADPNGSGGITIPIVPPNNYYPTLTIANTTFQGYQTSGNVFTIANTGYTIEFGSNRGYMLLRSAGDHYLQSGASNLTRLFISSSGRIGIAKSSSLNATLDISGSVIITGSLDVNAGITGSLLGTASYATQALTASNANTASFVVLAQTASFVNGTINVTQATIGISGAPALYTTNKATVTAGTTTVHSFSSSSYQGAFVDYTISDGVNARAGQIQTIFLSGQLQYNETTTMDVGNTDDFVWQVVVNGINIDYNSVVASGTWVTKLIIRSI